MSTDNTDSAPDRAQAMRTRRAVLGDAHVDRASANATPFDQPFQDLITDAAWGRVWSRETITHRERSMLTIALLCAGGHWDEVAMHVRATANTGCTADDLQDVVLHIAIYSGVPTANHAIKIIKATLAEMEDH